MASRGAKPPDDNYGDFTIDLGTGAKTSLPKVVAPTIELSTSDLKELEQSGEAKAKAQLVIQTREGKVVELAPGWSQDTPVPDADGGMPSIIVEDGLEPIRAAAPAPPRAVEQRPARARSGAWLVVVVYIVAAAALGLAIYERFVL